MGSTNGTFVNGEKIAGRALLQEGDRILVGTSIIKVVGVEGSVAQQARPRQDTASGRRAAAPARRRAGRCRA